MRTRTNKDDQKKRRNVLVKRLVFPLPFVGELCLLGLVLGSLFELGNQFFVLDVQGLSLLLRGILVEKLALDFGKFFVDFGEGQTTLLKE